MDELALLKKQVEDLSSRVNALEDRLKSNTVKAVVPSPKAPSGIGRPIPARSETLEHRVGGTWLNRLGVITVVMGLAFFLKFAFDNNWITVLGRLAIGVLVGIACLLTGHYYQHRGALPRFGVGLSAAGLGAWYVTCYAAYGYYSLLGHYVAFGCFLSITMSAIALALVYNSRALLGLAAVSGFITPLIIGGTLGYGPKFFYLLLLNACLFVAMLRKGWHSNGYVNLIGTYVVFVYILALHLTKELWPVFLALLSALHLLFVVFCLCRYWLRSEEDPNPSFHWISTVSYVVLACALFEMKQSTYLTFTMFAWSSLYFIGYAFVNKVRKQDTSLKTLLLMLGILHLTIIPPVTFTTHWITLAWVLQAGLLFVFGSGRAGSKSIRAWSLIVLALAFYRLISVDYMFSSSLSFFTRAGHSTMLERLPVLLIAVGVALFIGLAYHRAQDITSFEKNISPLLVIVANVVLLIGLMREASIFYYSQRVLSPDVNWWVRENATHSLTMIAHGLTLIVAGIMGKMSYIRKAGVLLLLVTVAKVALMDLTGLETVWRIIVFLVTGIVLIAASYLYQRFVLPKSTNQLEA